MVNTQTNAQTPPRRTLGRTGLEVSAVGMGGAFLVDAQGNPSTAAVERAIERGITYFDTSPGYCRGRSQSVMGDALGGARSRVVLATKLGYMPALPDHRDANAITRQLEHNLQLLGTDDVDVLQIHEADLQHWWVDNPMPWQRIDPAGDYDFANAPVVQVLADAKRRGLCRHIGITGNNAPAMTRVLRELDPDTFLLAFNYDTLHRDALLDAWPTAQQQRAGIINAAVLQCGRLAVPHPEWVAAKPDWMSPAQHAGYEKLLSLSQQAGLPLVALGLRFAMANPAPSMTLVGAASAAEVDQSVDLMLQGPLPTDLHDAVESLIVVPGDSDRPG